MATDTRFWDKMAARYSKQPISDEASYQKKLKMTRELFNSDFKLLEFGCGTGSTAIAHAPYVKHIHAIDFSSNMLKIAKERVSASGVTNIVFEQSTLEDLNINDESKDMVLGLSILHLLPNYQQSIQRVYQIVKPGGYFVSSTVCLGNLSRVLRWIIPLGNKLGLMPSVSFFSKKDLETELLTAGFIIDTIWQPKNDSAVFIIARKPG